jgi:DNA repair exonuclease SbcCD ATPase subunit
MSEATVLTSENSAEFYANKLGLAAEPEVEAVVEETPTEPTEVEEQSEPIAEDEEKVTEERKPNPKLEKRFSELTKQREQLRKEAEAERQKREELETRLKALESQAAPKVEQSRDEKPRPDQFVDAFEYAEALADWSAENAVMRARQEDVERKIQEERNKVIESWNNRVESTKSELPDFDEMVASSDVVVSDQVRDAILESDVGPRILYHLAENPEIAEKISKSSLITALREIGKLEARFEKTEPKEVKPVAVKSKAPAPISPIKAGTSEQVIVTDTDKMTFAQYKAMRQAKRIR